MCNNSIEHDKNMHRIQVIGSPTITKVVVIMSTTSLIQSVLQILRIQLILE